MRAHPFLKWAGGKTQLIDTLSEILPRHIRTYHEPFLGGGALFFALAESGRFERAVLNDCNRELVDTYRVVRDFPEDLITVLQRCLEAYRSDPEGAFSAWRDMGTNGSDPVVRAARMICLNRTGFNGLYRVNRAGRFNVAFGKHKNPRICDAPNIYACSLMLDRLASLRQGDFLAACKDAREGDVVFFDPPYVPLTASSNFTSYTADGFTLQDQYRLALLFRELFDKGVAAVLSNSDTPVVRALFAGFELVEVQVNRHISVKGETRGAVGELIVVGRRSKAIALPTIEEMDALLAEAQMPVSATTGPTPDMFEGLPEEDDDFFEGLPDEPAQAAQ